MALGKVIQRIEIEMSGGTKQYMVSAKQGDRATRYVETVLLNHGKPYTIPAGSSVTAFIRKPDRHRVYTPCEFTDNVVMVELDSQALAAAGTALCEVEVKSSDLMQVVTSVTFEIEIEAKVKDDFGSKATVENAVDFTFDAIFRHGVKFIKSDGSEVTMQQILNKLGL